MNEIHKDNLGAGRALSTLEAFLGRRPSLIACLALFILVLAIVGVNPFKQTLAPMDLLLSYSGWDNAGIETPLVNPQRSDVLDHRLPHWRFFRSELRQGRLPFWNPLHQLGAPGIEVPAYEGLTLPFLVFAAVPDESLGYTLAVISDYLLAAFGTYILLFFMFRDRTAAVFGALVFTFTGFNVAWAHWPHLTTSAWIPWVLAAQLRYWQTGKFGWGLLFAFSVAALGLAGFPFVALLGAISAALLMVVLVATDAYRSQSLNTLVWRLVGMVCAGLAGVAIAYPAMSQLLQVLKYTDLSHRHGGTGLSISDLPHLIGREWVTGTLITVESTFFSGTVPAICALTAAVVWALRPNRYAFFGLLIGIFVLLTAYGLGPHKLIQLIPFFDMNPWNRCGLLVGLSFAVLSAHVISDFRNSQWSSRNRMLSMILLLCGFVFQTYQLADQFQLYNAKPARESYFPPTPSLTFVSNHLAPLQSIIADSSFIVSGTVSNYGIAEIMAHGFRTDAQRSILKEIAPDSSATTTASMGDCSKFRYNDDDATYAGVKYFLTRAHCSATLMEQEGKGQRPSELLNQGQFEGNLVLTKALHPDNLEILFGTYEASYFSSDLRLQLFSQGRLIAQSDIPANQVANNKYASFPLNLTDQLSPGNYTYNISVIKPDPSHRLSVWTFEQSGDATYKVGTKEFQGAARLRLVSRSTKSGNLIVHSLEPGIDVVENTPVRGSGYLVPSLDGAPQPDYSKIRLNRYVPTDFDFSYDGTAKGWFIVPMRTAEEWSVTVNGNPVETSLFRGLYPAVPVEGTSTIHFAYNPNAFLMNIKIAAGILMACLAALYLVGYRTVGKSRQ